MDLFFVAAPLFALAIYMLGSSSRLAGADGSQNARASTLRLTIGLVLLFAAGWACVVGGFALVPGMGFEFDLP